MTKNHLNTIFMLATSSLLMAAMPSPTFADIRQDIEDAYSKKYQSIRSICVEYRLDSFDTVIPQKQLWDKYRTLNWGSSNIRVILDKDGRFYAKEEHAIAATLPLMIDDLTEKYTEYGDSVLEKVSFEEAIASWSRVKSRVVPQPKIVCYDLIDLVSYQPGMRSEDQNGNKRKVYAYVDPTRSNSTLPQTLLDFWLLTFEISGLAPAEKSHEQNRIPNLFGSGFKAVTQNTSVDGTRFVTLEDHNNSTIVMDPTKDYTVVKRQWRARGQLVFEVSGKEFLNLSEGIWLPKKFETTEFGTNAEDLGKPIVKRLYTVSLAEINDPSHAAAFTVKIPPGSIVIDGRLKPIDSSGKVQDPIATNTIPSVTYAQPADLADLEETIKSAVLDQGNRLSLAKPSQNRSYPYLSLVVIALIATFGGLIYVRRKRSC